MYYLIGATISLKSSSVMQLYSRTSFLVYFHSSLVLKKPLLWILWKVKASSHFMLTTTCVSVSGIVHRLNPAHWNPSKCSKAASHWFLRSTDHTKRNTPLVMNFCQLKCNLLSTVCARCDGWFHKDVSFLVWTEHAWPSDHFQVIDRS